MLVQRGTLEVGDALVAGASWGKVRAMVDYTGERVNEAVPGQPVEVLGFDGVPDAGDPFRVVENDRTARSLANERAVRLRQRGLGRRAGRKVSFEELFTGIKEGELKELNLVLKADVSGSLEAFEDEIARLPQDEVQVNVIHTGVGGITESDVMLAAASDAVILGFNVRPVGDARQAAEREGVEIRAYSVIYRAIEDLRDAMTGLLEPEQVEETVGTVEVRQTFRASRIGTIAGSYVTDGRVRRGAKVRVVRDGTVIYETTIDSLKRFNDDAREVAAGYECGIVLANFQDVKEGDVFEVYETRAVERALGVSSYFALLEIHLHFPEAGSLKAKRAELQSIKAQLRTRHGLAAAEVDHQDAWQRSTLAAAAAAGPLRMLDESIDRVVRWLDERCPQGVRVDRRVTSFDEAEV